MDKAIEMEQKRLANHFKSISKDEREKQAYGLLCWLQGHEAGYQAGLNAQGVFDGEVSENG